MHLQLKPTPASENMLIQVLHLDTYQGPTETAKTSRFAKIEKVPYLKQLSESIYIDGHQFHMSQHNTDIFYDFRWNL